MKYLIRAIGHRQHTCYVLLCEPTAQEPGPSIEFVERELASRFDCKDLALDVIEREFFDPRNFIVIRDDDARFI